MRRTTSERQGRSMVPCQSHSELFFDESPVVLARGQQLCARCPVQELCLAGAMERREPHGVWGGRIFIDGVVVESKRARGRPRKVVA